jgi:tungstate transport system substrate-binding protein
VTLEMTVRRRLCVTSLLCVVLALASACDSSSGKPTTVDIATTTSVVNSGLLDSLLPAFQSETGIVVRVHAAGSGRALEMLNDGVVDLAISHAPHAEADMLARHGDWRYRKIATNQFVVVGPPTDPAGVRDAADIASALTRIAAADAGFISRGDGSGTHERESELWTVAQVKPAPGRMLVSGAGMGATLRQAEERGAYTLTDDSTFMQLRQQLTLAVLFSNDPRLVNSYSVVHPRNNPTASTLSDWLAQGKGRERLGAYRIGGTPAFTPWPEGCPGEVPAAALCSNRR